MAMGGLRYVIGYHMVACLWCLSDRETTVIIPEGIICHTKFLI